MLSANLGKNFHKKIIGHNTVQPATVLIYTPDQWGNLERFIRFYNHTHNFKKTGNRAVSGTANHFYKALTLKELALKLAPTLAKDEAELNKYGHTNAVNSKELSAVIESIILELYSSVDCSRKVLTEIYTGYKGIPDSTRKFFKNIASGNIDNRLPKQIISAVEEAEWFNSFRIIRDELTHLDTGSCYKDKSTGKIRYMHTGLQINGQPLVIEDIFEKIDQTISEVNQFIGKIFAYLNSELKDEPITQFCGIFNGRMYMRHVSPHDSIDFHSGICESHKWFDLEGNPTCIFSETCGAYKKAKTQTKKT